MAYAGATFFIACTFARDINCMKEKKKNNTNATMNFFLLSLIYLNIMRKATSGESQSWQPQLSTSPSATQSCLLEVITLPIVFDLFTHSSVQC